MKNAKSGCARPAPGGQRADVRVLPATHTSGRDPGDAPLHAHGVGEGLVVRSHDRLCDVPLEAWNGVVSSAEVALETGHLAATEASPVNDVAPWYLVARDGEDVVGVAHFFE